MSFCSLEAFLSDPKLDNLKRWMESGQADQWVEAHSSQWSYSEWLTFLDELKAGSYWPMSPDDIGCHIESLARQYREQRTEILARIDHVALRRAIWWYLTGLAVVGAASGFFAGASHTPIVGTLLPLLFALIGGTSGIYLATADLSAPVVVPRLQWLGRALGFFGMACLIGSATGIALRLHYERPAHASELVTLWHGKAQDALQLAALRSKLDLLGLSPEERTHVLAAAAQAVDDASRPIDAERVHQIAAQARQLRAELKGLREKAVAAQAHVPQSVDDLLTALDFFCHQTEPWVSTAMPRDLYKNAVENIWFSLSHIAMPKDAETAVFVHQAGFDTPNLYKLFETIHAEFELRDDLDWELGGTTADRLDKFLQWATKLPKVSQDPEEVMPTIDTTEKSQQSKPESGRIEKKP